MGVGSWWGRRVDLGVFLLSAGECFSLTETLVCFFLSPPPPPLVSSKITGVFCCYFLFLVCVLLLFVLCAVDVGFFLGGMGCLQKPTFFYGLFVLKMFMLFSHAPLKKKITILNPFRVLMCFFCLNGGSYLCLGGLCFPLCSSKLISCSSVDSHFPQPHPKLCSACYS